MKKMTARKTKKDENEKKGSYHQLTPPSPFDNDGKPINWGTGLKDGGAGAWKSHNRDVARMVDNRR